VQAERAFSSLAAVAQGADPGMSTTEAADLAFRGLLRSVSPTTKSQLELAVAELPALTERVRQAGRELAGMAGRRDRPVEAARKTLRELTGRLEELTRTQAALEGLMWNPSTGTFAGLTLAGRRTLANLATWRARFGTLSLEEFLAQMGRTRQGLESIVRRAKDLLLDLESADLLAEPHALRVPAIILAKRGITGRDLRDRFARCLYAVREAGPEGLVAAAILASEDNLADALERLPRAEEALRRRDLAGPKEAVVAVSLLDLDPSAWDDVFDRMDAVKRAVVGLDAISLLTLARSPHGPEEAASRYGEAAAHVARSGPREGDEHRAAAAILAATTLPVRAACERFSRHMSQITGMYDPPHVEAAMLASSPLDPAEALDVLKEAVGAVTRVNYFDGTVEIPSLALLVVHGAGPEIARFVAEAGPPSLVPGRELAPAPARFVGRDPMWYLWHDRWVYRRTMWYLRTHPVHVHTVPHFG